MPRDSAGNFTLVPGNPVQSGEVIASTWANSTLSDVSVALTDSLDRYGRGGMLAPFKFSDGTHLLPGASWVNEPTTGFYRFDNGDLRAAVLTQDIMRWQSTGAQVWNIALSQWENILTSNTIPTPVPDGTADGQTLRWEADTSTWDASSDLVISDTGRLTSATDATESPLLTFLDGRTTDIETVGGEVQFRTSDDVLAGQMGFSASNSLLTLTNRTTGPITFRTGGTTERMRISSNGNVGIGNTSPNVALVVDGQVRSTDGFLSPSGDTAAAPGYSWNTDEDTGMFRLASNTVGFATNGVEMLRTNTTATFVEGGYSALDRVAGTASSVGQARIYRFLTLTQSQYNSLTPDANTLYFIIS